MTPVISPWVFYWLSVSDGIGGVLTTLLISCGLITIFFIVKGFAEKEDWHDEEKSKETFKLAKRLGVILAILMVLDVFIPTADTITKMIVAQNVTYERVEAATDVVQTVYEDIMNMFEEQKVE